MLGMDYHAMMVERMDCLTPYQKQVAWLLVSGITNNKGIAAAMNTRPNTVHNHINGISSRLRVHGRVQIAVYLLTGYRPERLGEDE